MTRQPPTTGRPETAFRPGAFASVPDLRDSPSPPGRLLGNGSYHALLTVAGTGGSWLGDYALTRWRADRVQDEDGWFLYLRDTDDGAFWSLGSRPVSREPEEYEVRDGPGWLAIARVDDGIESSMEAWVDAAAPIECRRVVLRNRSHRTRRLELTSWLEVVLDDSRAFEAHPGFSKLFIQTEALPSRGGLLARRRPRSPDELRPWLAHALLGDGSLQFETDRARFLGRGGDLRRPRALTAAEPLSGTQGAVLDPILSLRRGLALPPDASAELTLVLAASPSRDGALETVERLGRGGAVKASRESAEALARERTRRLRLEDPEALRLERLAAALLYGDPRLRPPPETWREAQGSADLLRRLGIELEGPLLLVEPGAVARCLPSVLAACTYWRELGLAATVVAPASAPEARAAVDGLGGKTWARIIDRDRLTSADLGLLHALARAVVVEGFPDLDATATSRNAVAIREATGAPLEAPAASRDAALLDVTGAPGPSRPATGHPVRSRPGEETLRCFNGFGGFSADGREYVIRLAVDRDGALRRPPMPWVNVLANPTFGCVTSESGASFTWSRNSREFRITPWSNDPVRDPHHEALYLRDEESRAYWSPLPGPVAGEGPYEVRHGFGYSVYRHASQGVELTTTVFVAASDPVKVVRVRLANLGPDPRRLSLFSYQRLALGAGLEECARTVVTSFDPGLQALLARQPVSEQFHGAVVFASAIVPGTAAPLRFTADRAAFLGRGGAPARPDALGRGAALDGRTGADLEPCFALEVGITLGPRETREVAFVLGEAEPLRTVGELLGRLRQPGALDDLEREVRARWADLLDRVRVETPVESLDLVVNGWLAYQTLACRLWARSAFYQSGGAFGFRDQLQDAAAFLPIDPSITRRQLLLHAAHQFVEGDVLHWWHPPDGRGLRTRFADDLLWLPYLTASYVRHSGDAAVLSETVPFLTAPPLEEGEQERYLLPEESEEKADLYHHCCRAIDRSLATGSHGLPRFGSGDWNDGMNRVGREGRGESVWMAFFLHAVLEEFIPLCEDRSDRARAGRYRAHQDRLRAAVESAGWDGEWYRRGYYDDGTVLGSRASDECRIDALAQAWAVLSGAAPRARAEVAMNAVERHLISDRDGIIRLLAPPFDRTSCDPGYIKGYVPGVRENGGQYTHAALWVVRALVGLGRNERAAQLLEMLSPVCHARTEPEVARYQVEPYVVAADVYGEPPHVGRGGWTWYTGSAGWMLRVALESLLGVTIENGRTLVVRPGVPKTWRGYRVTLRPPGCDGSYSVEVSNPSGLGSEVSEAYLDDFPIPFADGGIEVPLVSGGKAHRVRLILGSASGIAAPGAFSDTKA